MIVLTPEQWARLQKGSERISDSEKRTEEDLSKLLKGTKSKNRNKQAETFDRFQTLFHRFISDQKRSRQPLRIPLQAEDEWVDYNDGDDDAGGTSFSRTLAGGEEQREIPTYESFTSRDQSKTKVSTPRKVKKKRKGLEVTPKRNLLTQPRKLRSKVKWEGVKVQ